MENHLENNQMQQLLTILKQRYETNMYRHAHIEWAAVYKKLSKNPIKLLSLYQMEEGGGEPDVVVLDSKSFEVIYGLKNYVLLKKQLSIKIFMKK